MFFHTARLEFESKPDKPDKPDPVYALSTARLRSPVVAR
jgi:hypothetical protein